MNRSQKVQMLRVLVMKVRINLNLFVRDEDVYTLASSRIFSSFSNVRSASSKQKIKLARAYLRRENTSKLGHGKIFDLVYYKANFPKGKKKPSNYMLHYLKTGWREDLRPSILIDVEYYKHQAAFKSISVDCEPFQHYSNTGYIHNLFLSMYFDNDWYRATYMKEDDQTLSPFEHFVHIGAERKYSPSAFFVACKVEDETGLTAGSTHDALEIYIDHNNKGMHIDPHPLFDSRYYLKTYTDVSESKLSPLAHYTAYGSAEARKTMDLTYSAAEQSEGIDAFQYKFVDFNNYFGIRRHFQHYGLLYELSSAITMEDLGGKKRPLAIIAMFNDADCIEYILRAAIREGLSLWLIDNWSTDETFDIISRLSKDEYCAPFIEGIERFPVGGPSKDYDWTGILERKQNLAALHPGRWILHQDSDEITVSLFGNRTCGETLHAIERLGYNAVNMRMFDFRPITKSLPDSELEEYFKYFEFSNKPGYGAQIKAWIQPDYVIDLSGSGGHYATFDGIRAFPLRMPRKHYALRSVDHARRKIMQERLPRFEKERKEKGWHTHYDDKFDENKYVWDKETLQEYLSVGNVSVWFDYLYNEEFVQWGN